MRVPRESGSRAERPLGRAKGEGRFGGGAVNGLAARGAPLNAQRGPDIRVNKVVPRNRPALWVCFAFSFGGGKAAMDRIFTGAIDASRVNPLGLALMALALLLAALSGVIAGKTPLSKGTVKIMALVICAGGALLAILG